jgi:radical SAM-linked protein
VRYAKRDRLRFASHRDVARILERALRRAEVPIASSAGFNPHPRISYMGACPTGVASDAEYLELGLSTACRPDLVRIALDSALPPGIDIVEVADAAEAVDPASLADRLQASKWRLVLHGAQPDVLERAVVDLLAAESIMVTRLMKDGPRQIDARAAVLGLAVGPGECAAGDHDCATLFSVVRHTTPTVRPDDVLTALRAVADLAPAEPPGSGLSQVRLEATRLAQGRIYGDGQVLDPLAP